MLEASEEEAFLTFVLFPYYLAVACVSQVFETTFCMEVNTYSTDPGLGGDEWDLWWLSDPHNILNTRRWGPQPCVICRTSFESVGCIRFAKMHSHKGLYDKAPTRSKHPNIIMPLKKWLVDNTRYPYPTRAQKNMLAQATGLTTKQVAQWFNNARKRLLLNVDYCRKGLC